MNVVVLLPGVGLLQALNSVAVGPSSLGHLHIDLQCCSGSQLLRVS